MEAVPAAPEENENLFSMTLTQRGCWQVSVNGKLYQQSGQRPKKTIDEEADITSLRHVLRCSNWKEHRCPARATITQEVPTDDMEAREANKKLHFAEEFSSFTLTNEDHSNSCPNVILFTEIRAFTNEIKNAMAADIHLHFADIYQNAFTALPANVQAVVPTMVQMSSTAYRVNAQLERDPRCHSTLDLASFPPQLLVNNPNVAVAAQLPFIRAIERTVPDANGNCATLMFCYTDTYMKEILRANRLSTDGTFKGISQCWKTLGGTGQLIIVYFYLGRRAMPGAYILASHKTKLVYDAIFRHIVNKATEFNQQAVAADDRGHVPFVFAPSYMNMDFEMAIWSAVREQAPAVHITGCNYHFTAQVYKLIVDYGLKTEYHNPMVFPSVKEIARLVNALSFVPEEQVAEAFQQIHRYSATTLAHPRIGIKMTNFLEDIRTRWLTRIPDWNVYVLEQGQQRTNNDAESFNMSWNQSVSSRNTLWQYVHKLQLSQQAQETRYAQHLLGQPISRIQERKQRDKEKAIARVKENFVAERYNTLLQYCQALSAYMYSAA